MRLGITLECIAPAKPQQNGRLERFDRTLAVEVLPAADVVEQQRRFDEFRRVYNHERPHSALALQPPSSVYRRSLQRYPRPLLRWDVTAPPEHCELVDRRGRIAWRRQRIFIGEAFAGENVAVWPADGQTWELYSAPSASELSTKDAPRRFNRRADPASRRCVCGVSDVFACARITDIERSNGRRSDEAAPVVPLPGAVRETHAFSVAVVAQAVRSAPPHHACGCAS